MVYMATRLSSLFATRMIALLLKKWVDQVGWQHAQLQKIEARRVQHFGSSMESPIWDGWAKWAVSKTLVICCIWKILIPSYMGIMIRHYKDPEDLYESIRILKRQLLSDDQNVTNAVEEKDGRNPSSWTTSSLRSSVSRSGPSLQRKR